MSLKGARVFYRWELKLKVDTEGTLNKQMRCVFNAFLNETKICIKGGMCCMF